MELWDAVNGAVVLLVGALVALVGWYLRGWLKERIGDERLTAVSRIVSLAVQAAEMYGGSAAMKKTQALTIAQRWLGERGIYIDVDALDEAIEAAVWAELARYKTAVIELPELEVTDAEAL